MNFQIVKTNKPSIEQITEIRKLYELARAADDCAIKIYWDILHKRGGNYISDYFFYREQQLVTVLNLYRFKPDLVEITALTHPEFRKQGHFRILFQEALQELKRCNILTLAFMVNEKAKNSINFLSRRHAKFDHSEDQIMATPNFTLPENSRVELRLAQKEELDILAKIHFDSFNGDIQNHRQYISKCFTEENYEIWVCLLQGELIGKIHLYYNEFNEVLIHDLGIRKEFRRGGYGTEMLKCLLKILFTKPELIILADIYTKDAGVVEYYRKCEFQWLNRFNFYHSPLSKWI
jgi:ribosomal protein S18 acetylase RimI-like enzyme